LGSSFFNKPLEDINKVKISVIADCHLNKALYKGILDKKYTMLPFRTVDFMKAFFFIVTQNIEKIKPDLIVIAGDIYDTYDPSNEVRGFFNGQFKRLSDAGIPVILLVGNHDVCRKHHALYPLKTLGLKGLDIIEEPQMKVIDDKIFLLFPYSIKVERDEISIRDQFYHFIEETHKTIAENPQYADKDIFFFGHFGVKGAVLKTYAKVSDEHVLTNKTVTKKKQRVNNKANDISLDDLEKINAKYIFLGDYHQHQILPIKNGIAMYAGSIERTDMSEFDQTKGYIVYDDNSELDEYMGKVRFIEYPNCRPMIEFRGNTKEIMKALNDLPTKGVRGAIVKVAFVGNHKELLEFSTSLDDIRKQIKNNINPVHMYHQQKVIDEINEEEAHRLEEEVIEKGALNEELVLRVVEEMIVEKESDPKEQRELVMIAQDIYKETMDE
jgi:exonuclease SbcD